MRDVTYHFENKNFAVVGASSGIGRQIALDLAEAGAHVLAIARNEGQLRELQDSFPHQITIQMLDVLKAKKEDWDMVLRSFVEMYGAIHGGVYAAGIHGLTPLRMFDDELAYRIMETSFWSMIRFTQQATRKKIAKKGSSFVVFSSVAAHIGDKGSFAYSAGKGAVMAAVRTVAKEICHDGHRINSISPGWVVSDMTKNAAKVSPISIVEKMKQSHPLGIGIPDDVSGMVLFLLSDTARWITGIDVVVDGGFLIGV